MKIYFACVLFAISEVVYGHEEENHEDKHDICAFEDDLGTLFQQANNEFSAKMFKETASMNCRIEERAVPHFTVSASNTFMTLAAIVEGSDGTTQHELLDVLNLPQDECQRKMFNRKSLIRDQSNIDIIFNRNRILGVDKCLQVNHEWRNSVATYQDLEVIRFPLKSNPVKSALEIRRIISSPVKHFNGTGNSLLLNSLDYQGLWTTAFPNAVIEKKPFYDDEDKHIGYVDMMQTKMYVMMGYVKSLKSKVIEIPVGPNGRYRVFMAQRISEGKLSEIIEKMPHNIFFEIRKSLRQSRVPVEVAIPRFTIDSEHDLRPVLESMGLTALWQHPEECKRISEPASFVTGYLQRVSVTFDTAGVNVAQKTPENTDLQPDCDPKTGLNPLVGLSFVANHPMLFSILDSKTFTSIVSGVFSVPTYELEE